MPHTLEELFYFLGFKQNDDSVSIDVKSKKIYFIHYCDCAKGERNGIEIVTCEGIFGTTETDIGNGLKHIKFGDALITDKPKNLKYFRYGPLELKNINLDNDVPTLIGDEAFNELIKKHEKII